MEQKKKKISIGTKYEFCKWLSKTVPEYKPVFLEGGDVLEDGDVHYSALVKSTEPEWMEVDWCKEVGFWNFLIFDKAEILKELKEGRDFEYGNYVLKQLEANK